MPTNAWGVEITEGAYGCRHRFPDGTFCDAKEARYQGVHGWCWGHRPRTPGAKYAERNARLAKRLAEEARHLAAIERNAAREEYDKLSAELVEAAVEMEAALPPRLRGIVAKLSAAEARWESADETLDARIADLVAASDAYETARTR